MAEPPIFNPPGAVSPVEPDLIEERYRLGLNLVGTITSLVNSNAEREGVEKQMVSGLREVFQCAGGAIILKDPVQQHVLIKKSLNADSDWVYQACSELGLGLTSVCLDTGQAILIGKPERDPRYSPSIDASPGITPSALLFVPIVFDNHLMGALELQHTGGLEFLPSDQTLLEMLAVPFSSLLQYLNRIYELREVNAHLEASRWELVRSRNTLRSLFDNLPDSLYIIDQKYHLIAINMARARRADCEPRLAVNSLCYDVLYQRSQPCPNCLVGETFFYKRTTHRTERHWEEGDTPQEWEISAYPIIEETEQVIQTILFERDVTEKNNVETILAQSEKMAAVGQLAAGLAHEINNPLTVILANAQLLQRDLADGSDEMEAVDLISRAGTRALQVVRNLLNFARKEQFELVSTDINQTLYGALEMLRHEALERSVDLNFEAGKNLPAIMASADNLQGVWVNILLNAVDSAEPHLGKIKIITSQQGNELRVVIKDNGKGIPAENLKRIFDPFFTTKGVGRGTGLGLSICHRIIKQHGGHILVDSEVGKGTTFTIGLPVY